MSRSIQDFQRIYNALYHGRTTYFKNKTPKNYTQIKNPMTLIEAHAKNNPDSITAKALKIYKTETATLDRIAKLTCPKQKSYETIRLENWVFSVVHRYCASHSGFFSRTSNPKHKLYRFNYAGQLWTERPKDGRSRIIVDHLKFPVVRATY